MWNFSMVVLDAFMVWLNWHFYKTEDSKFFSRLWLVTAGFWLGSFIFDLIALFGGN